MTRRAVWILVLASIALGILIGLSGCGDAGPRPDVPAAGEESRLRAQEPPAAAEVKDLDAQRRAAELAAAKAKAAGDEVEAQRQKAFAAEVVKLLAAAKIRETQERAALDKLADDAHQRAIAERREIDQRGAAAERQADIRNALMWGGFAIVAAAVLGVLALKRIVPLWIAAIPIACAVGYVGWHVMAPEMVDSFAIIGRMLGWLLIAGVLVAIAIGVRRLWMVAQAGAAHGDALEARIVDAMAGADDAVRAKVSAAIAEVKGSSKVQQVGAGIHAAVQAVRAKAAKV